MAYGITVNLRIQATSQTQNPGLEYTPRAQLNCSMRRRAFYLWFYGKLKPFLWAVSVSSYAASVAFQTPVVENIYQVYHTNSFVSENTSCSFTEYFVDFEMSKRPGIYNANVLHYVVLICI